MRKIFPLEVPGKKAPRVIDSIKHEVRKYLKRERRKTLPKGVDFWDFDCRVGENVTNAEDTHIAAINKAIDTLSEKGVSGIYLEIHSKHGHRTKKKST
jgi:hypothetical protein